MKVASWRDKDQFKARVREWSPDARAAAEPATALARSQPCTHAAYLARPNREFLASKKIRTPAVSSKVVRAAFQRRPSELLARADKVLQTLDSS